MTTTIIIYRLKSKSNHLFAHCVRSEKFEINGVPVFDAETTFYASIPASESPETDRIAVRRFVLSEHRWPLKIPVVWDDTGEIWEI